MRPRLVWVLAVSTGLAVANMYYVQPLLALISHSFGISQGQAGIVGSLTQFGYALGLLLIVPLGDAVDRRRLATTSLMGVTVFLVATALAPSVTVLALASFALGLTGVAPQILVPFAASLAQPAVRGRVVGTVMSGLLIGILLARTVSGLIGQLLGWRAMYWIAAGLVVAVQVALRMVLPVDLPRTPLRYASLLRSLARLAVTEPVLREVGIFGGLAFGAFSAFWVTLAFFLATPPYHYGSGVVGLFGLAGVGGALAASFSGRLSDRFDARRITLAALGAGLLAYANFWLAGSRLWGLALGVILLDLGTQAAHISNQSRIYSLPAALHSRLNTVYMVAYFAGGSLGSAVGVWAWSEAGWPGVCAAGSGLLLTALAVYAWTALRRRVLRPAS